MLKANWRTKSKQVPPYLLVSTRNILAMSTFQQNKCIKHTQHEQTLIFTQINRTQHSPLHHVVAATADGTADQHTRAQNRVVSIQVQLRETGPFRGPQEVERALFGLGAYSMCSVYVCMCVM